MFDEDVKLPESLKPKGHVKLELIDKDTKEIVNTVEKDNFISKGMEWMYQTQMKLQFMSSMILTDASNRTFNISQNITGVSFERMYLTTANHDEDPKNEWFIKGDVLGEASLKTGSLLQGDKGGQLNTAESFINESMMRVVIDFPAGSVNGSIGSVYFLSDKVDASSGVRSHYYYVFDNLITTESVRSQYYDRMRITKYRDYTYVSFFTGSVHNGNVLIVYDENLNPVSTRLITKNSHSYSIPTSICGVGDKLYLSYGDEIYSVNLFDVNNLQGHEFRDGTARIDGILELLDSVTKVTTLSEGKVNRGLLYDPKQERFYVGTGNSGDMKINVYDKNFSIINSSTVSGTNGEYILYFEDGFIITTNGSIDISSWSYTPSAYRNMIGFTDDGLMYNRAVLTGDHSGDIKIPYGAHSTIFPRLGFSSRAKLPSPVIKTEQHIMKVTYDFKFPSIYGDKEN